MKPFSGLLVAGVALSSVGATGCHHAFGCTRAQLSEWRLDSERKIEIVTFDSIYPLWAGDVLTYSRAILRVLREDGSRLDDAELCYRYGLDRMKAGPLRFENIEIRADDNRTKLWIVDSESRSIIATYNLGTGEVSDHRQNGPAWARADSGILLNRIRPAESIDLKNQSRG
ncbi:MAG TPA: hypothetical protein VJZ71_19530 [Phycisphaerae bacterium]|nr:hypothetical protein [Phycisphaerae bacterium]